MLYSKEANQNNLPFILPQLPYDKKSFGKVLSEESFDFHYGKHHLAYVNNLNKLLENDSYSSFKDKSLEEIILESYNKQEFVGIFNNAAQIWNHTFFWHSITPNNGGGEPGGKLLAKINEDFGSFTKFADEFKQAGLTQFGSGWSWLVLADGRLKVMKSLNAENPICLGYTPLICCDVWEHAYYIDYRNMRADFLNIFLDQLVNWDFATKNLGF